MPMPTIPAEIKDSKRLSEIIVAIDPVKIRMAATKKDNRPAIKSNGRERWKLHVNH